MSDKLIIFDTTLRDGEQSPGASMTRDEKLRIARQLERMKVDVIEAGFAASSNGDFEAVKAIAAAVKGATTSPNPSPANAVSGTAYSAASAWVQPVSSSATELRNVTCPATSVAITPSPMLASVVLSRSRSA